MNQRKFEATIIKKERIMRDSKNFSGSIYKVYLEDDDGGFAATFSDSDPFDGFKRGEKVTLVLETDQTTLQDHAKKK